MNVGFPNATSYIRDETPLLSLLNRPEGNFTNMIPSYILSGPSLLAIAVHKADPTAEE